MAGFCGLMFALGAVTGLFGYWISWEVQHQQKRPAFTTKLRNDVVRLVGRKSDGITASRTPAIISPGKLSEIHVRNVLGR